MNLYVIISMEKFVAQELLTRSEESALWYHFRDTILHWDGNYRMDNVWTMLVKIPYQHLKQVLNLHLQGAPGERPLRFASLGPVYKYKKNWNKIKTVATTFLFLCVIFSYFFQFLSFFLRGQPKSAKKYEKYENRTKSMKKYED